MELTHTFTVPASADETWAHFQDIESVAGCFPGATVTEVDGDDFKGSCKVKLGPIALVYSGTGSFVEKDDAAKRFVVEAKGKDKRGNGTAGATVTATMTDSGGSTDVTVVTDLAITGKPAQFGRGVIQDVSDKLLGQFVACLEQQVGAAPPAAAAAPAAEATVAGTAAPVEPAGSETPPAPPRAAPAAPAGTGGAGPGSSPRPTPPRAAAKEDDALDLGAAVVPILAKTYWRQALAGLVVLAIIIRLIRRR
jgi:carbon monoxide dehydrogenase subunit G